MASLKTQIRLNSKLEKFFLITCAMVFIFEWIIIFFYSSPFRVGSENSLNANIKFIIIAVILNTVSIYVLIKFFYKVFIQFYKIKNPFILQSKLDLNIVAHLILIVPQYYFVEMLNSIQISEQQSKVAVIEEISYRGKHKFCYGYLNSLNEKIEFSISNKICKSKKTPFRIKFKKGLFGVYYLEE